MPTIYCARVYEKLWSSDDSSLHGYLLLDLKPTTDDKQELKSNILPGENTVLEEYFKKKSCTQPPMLNAMYNSEGKMLHDILCKHHTWHQTRKWNCMIKRFLTFQSQLKNQLVVQNNLQATLNSSDLRRDIILQHTSPTTLPWSLLHLKPIFNTSRNSRTTKA